LLRRLEVAATQTKSACADWIIPPCEGGGQRIQQFALLCGTLSIPLNPISKNALFLHGKGRIQSLLKSRREVWREVFQIPWKVRIIKRVV